MAISRILVALVIVALLVTTVACGGSAPAPQPTAAPAAQPAKEAPKPAAKKLDFAYIATPTAPSSKAFEWFSSEVTKQTDGAITITYYPGTLLNKELEIMDAVKSGNVAFGSPVGAASSVFTDMGVFLLPYLVRDYTHAYTMFNGDIGKQLDEMLQAKNKMKILFFYDYGFRHFWNTKKPIAKPDDLVGMKMRVQQGKVFADTVNGLGASAVPMPFGEMLPAVQQGVVDGADLPIVNMDVNRVYEISKYASLTFHNYGPSFVSMNPDVWKGFTADQQKLVTDLAMQAQKRIREETESVDSFEGAKKLLGTKGMQVNEADLAAFRKVAEEKIWPQYKQQYPEMWDKIVSTK